MELPLLKVRDTKKQVLLIFSPFNGEHITLHPQRDGSILRTHSSKNKPESTWDDKRMEIAKECGCKDSAKHGKYYAHDVLKKVSNIRGYHLVGRKIDPSQIPKEKEGYKKIEKIIIDAPQKSCLVHLYLSTKENTYIPQTDSKFSTSLGEVFIKFEVPRSNN